MAETYHYHDTGKPTPQHSPECFDLTRSQVDDNLEWESDEFRAWILGNPSVGDTFYGEGNDVVRVQRVPDARVALPWWVRKGSVILKGSYLRWIRKEGKR